MKILYTIFSLTVGGAEKLLLDTVNYMASNNEDCIYLCVINKRYDEYLLKQVHSSVKVLLLNRPEGGEILKFLWEYGRFVIKNDIEIIHCQTIDDFKFSLFAKFIKPGIRIINTVHATKIFSCYKRYEIILSRLLAEKIIAISGAVKDEIASGGVCSNKIELIYNSIDVSRFSNVLRTKKGFDKKSIVIGNVARIIPWDKGQDVLIKAVSLLAAKYPGIKCIFAGAPPGNDPSYIHNLEKFAEENNVSGNIEFLGNVEDIPGFLAKIDIFVLPSRREGFGIALIEAMAAGIPCIASNIDGPREIIKDNDFGLLFEKDNYFILADKIDFIINNMDKYDRDKVIEYIAANFDTKVMMEKLYGLYKRKNKAMK